MAVIKKRPLNEDPSGWAVLLPPRNANPPLTEELRADWLVLGAGFTGLAAARRLAEAHPDDRVVVLDALEVGAGASGRNSGFAIDHAHTLGGGSAEAENARGQKRLYSAALEHMREIVESHGIDCDWRNDGKYHAAASARGADVYLKPLLEELDHIGEPYRWLARDQMREEVGIDHYEAGIYTPGTVLVNPAALARGLADALPENVTLVENTPAVRIDTSGSVSLTTPMGRIIAPKMILATNAFAPAMGFAKNRLLPFVAFASLTRAMTEAEQAALGGRPSWGVTPANAFVGATIQRTGDQRILFRETITYRPELRYGEGELEAMVTRHKDLFRKRFAMLDAVSLDHTWGGYLCLSRNQASVFGQLGEQIWGAAGHQGIGVTRGTISGILAADMAMGRDNPLIEDMMRIANPPLNPPRPFLDVGVAVRTAWEAWRDNDEA